MYGQDGHLRQNVRLANSPLPLTFSTHGSSEQHLKTLISVLALFFSSIHAHIRNNTRNQYAPYIYTSFSHVMKARAIKHARVIALYLRLET